MPLGPSPPRVETALATWNPVSKPNKKKKNEPEVKVVAKNKKAFREIDVEERFEAGIALTGTEIKSIRAGRVTIDQAHVQVRRGEVFLIGANVAEYAQGSWNNHLPMRARKLLLHKREIQKLQARIELRGFTILPLSLYLTPRGFAKLEIGIGRGKKLHDKREDLKKREVSREIDRQMKKAAR
ncbi:MAG: SsrA-binding protein SmpB [Planctomycetes bacterium]|nr:SsrA-binding protein SmpB [Planctomycetota bacterium]